MKLKPYLPAVLLLSSLLFCGCAKGEAGNARANEEIKETKDLFAMDTYISLTAYGEGADALLSEAENRIYELEKHLSVTDTESEIYAANHSGGMPVKVSEDTAEAVAFALDMMGKDEAEKYWKENGGFEMILLTDSNEIYLTEGIEDSFSLQEACASYPVTVMQK